MQTSEIVTDKALLSTWEKMYKLNLLTYDQFLTKIERMKQKYQTRRQIREN